MFVLFRALAYATLFIGLVLVLVPGELLARAGVAAPEVIGVAELAGIAIALAGGALALWCIVTFALVGGGTPAPFDPPRRLLVRGPYAVVRNPMYIGAGLALAGASLVYASLALLSYAAAFLLVTHLFVVLYEEPTLRRLFGAEYESYCLQVRRWWPRVLERGRLGGA
jgi:protein-S-isoprenylcysteine O-methyltransferase Ste14